MDQTLKSRAFALLCVVTLLFCALATYPIAEIGMNDDFAYIKTAQVLSQTGHISYNGWASAMLGWQLFLGALFARLLGPSFTVIRASTFLVALATAFLTHRTFVRFGINSFNATVATIALVVSPLFLPLALSFMTDIGGLFCIILCLYACLRSVQAESDRAVLGWLAFAVFSNTIGGTVRQFAWLGVLVMIPSTIWLLRRRRHVVVVGGILLLVSVVFIYESIRWFQSQPYSIPEPSLPALDRHRWNYMVGEFVELFFEFAMLLLPFLIAFASTKISFRNRLDTVFAFGAMTCVLITIFFSYRLNLLMLFAPFKGNYVTSSGILNCIGLKGERPAVLTWDLRFVITAATFLAVIYVFRFFLSIGFRKSQFAGALLSPSWSIVLTLLVPFAIAYLGLLLPRMASFGIWDRYLLPLLPIAIILLLRLLQERIRPKLPVVSLVLVLIFAVYSVAATHDVFGMYRAVIAMISQLRAAGVAETAIDGGFEYDGMVQIDHFGYINYPGVRLPRFAHVIRSSLPPIKCLPHMGILTPAIVPVYALSFDPNACGGKTQFAPVSYHSWLGPSINIYAVKTQK